MNDHAKLLTDGCRSFGITLNQQQTDQFLQYYHLLVDWNARINLTSITEFQDVLVKHFLDSLSAVRALKMFHVKHLMDIGSGAGFPGIPLKIVFPHLQVTLLDSLNKRIRFLSELTVDLNLSDVELIHGRAEQYAKCSQYRESYDLCVSRAVAPLNVLTEFCLPYVSVGGYFLAYKSGDAALELEKAQTAIKKLGGMVHHVDVFQLPDSDYSRSLILIQKECSTPVIYPRKEGIPSKRPLS